MDVGLAIGGGWRAKGIVCRVMLVVLVVILVLVMLEMVMIVLL